MSENRNMKSNHFAVSLPLLTLVVIKCLSASTTSLGLRIPEDSKHDAEQRLRADLRLSRRNATFVLPPHNDTSPVVVTIGLWLLLIRDMDAAAQTLTAEAWLSLAWTDTRLRWDASKYDNITVIRVPDHYLWQPDIKLYNGAKAEIVDAKGDVYVLLYCEGEIYWVPPVTVYAICPMDLKHYPYDVHSCELSFGSWTTFGYHIDLIARGVRMGDYLNSGGEWEVLSATSRKDTKFYDCCDEPYPSVTFTIVLQRRSPFYKMTVLFPIVAAFLLVLTSLSLSPFSRHRIALNVLGLGLLVLELFHLEFKLPAAGSNPPIIASLCGNLVILVTLTTVLTVCVVSFLGIKSHDNSPVPSTIKKFVDWWPIQMIGPKGIVEFSFVPFKYNQETEKLDSTSNNDAENPFNNSNSKSENYEEWLRFFQIVDRIVFVLFICVNIIVLIAVAI